MQDVTLRRAPYARTKLSYFTAVSPHQLGKIPTRCLPLRWLDGGVAQAGNRLTACLGKESVGAGKQLQLKSRE